MANPTIAIIGRPNVGKSTLFNRIIGQRKSIISKEEGVTRDRVYGSFDWQGRMFDLIDTGGYIPTSDNIIENQVRYQAELASQEADLIVLLIDGKSEITSSDIYLSKELKKSGKPFVLAINKIDELGMEDMTSQFYELGLGDFFTLSAQHNRCVGDLLDGILEKFPENKIKYSREYYDLSLAIIGMPNVGKSSLMNRLLEEQKSIVTSIAGTTRDTVDSYISYYKKKIRILDTAGLRKKSKISDNIEYYSTIRTNQSIRDCDIGIVMIDAEKGFTNHDREIISVIIKEGNGLIVAINKWDLIKKKIDSMNNFKKDMLDYYPALIHYPILFISVLHNLRVRDILRETLKIFKERKRKIKTTNLNLFIKKAIKHYPPPLIKGKNISIKYGTQVHHSPPVFVFFTNNPNLIPTHYKRYLENSLRENLGFFGTSIKISFRLG